jgi:hypothetical protein
MSADSGLFRQAIRQAGGLRAKAPAGGVLAGGRSDAFPYEFSDRVGHELDRDRGQQQARDTGHQLDAGWPSTRRTTPANRSVSHSTTSTPASPSATPPARTPCSPCA